MDNLPEIHEYWMQDTRHSHVPGEYGSEKVLLPTKYSGDGIREGCYIWWLYHCKKICLYIGRSDHIFRRLHSEWLDSTIIPYSGENSGFIWNYFHNLMFSRFKKCTSDLCDHIPRIKLGIVLTDNSIEVEKQLIDAYKPLLNKRRYKVDEHD
jgi:hypothetical protein